MKFKQSDLTRALRAFVAAGLQPGAVRFHPDGLVEVGVSDGADSSDGARRVYNPCDRLLKGVK